MKKEKENLRYSIFQNIVFLLRDIRAEHPVLLLFIAMQVVLSVVSPVFGIYMPKIALDLVLNRADIPEICLVLGSFGGIMALAMALSGMANEGKYLLYNDMRRYYQMQLFLRSLSCSYKDIESEEGQTKYQRAMNTLWYGDFSGTSVMLVAAVEILTSSLCFIIYSGIISALSPFMLLALVFLSLISLFSTRRAQKFEYEKRDETAKIDKKLNYIIYTGSDAAFGKDMRLYRTGGWFTDLRNTLIGQSSALMRKIQKRYFFAGAVNAFVLFLRDGVAYAYLIYSAASGRITVSDFTLYFGAITAFSGFVGGIVNSLNQLNGANLQMNSMRDFLDSTSEPKPDSKPLSKEQAAQEPDLAVPAEKYSIEFCDVCFSYTSNSGKKQVLNHFNLKIQAGEKVALVGVNGAGKTTVVKLLCGFYTPDSGQIRIGGRDIRSFEKEDLLRLFSTVFQDIYIPPFSVAETVSLKEKKYTEPGRVKASLMKAGLWEKISEFSEGSGGDAVIDAPMTREITEGIVLSGGQQQKLLMARALYKDAPIFILDEPTAALDPIAENQTYQQFHELTLEKTAIYISHRLASTRFCNKIAFLKDGKITEEGTHEELLAKQGDYCEMFTLQSQYYQKGKRGEENEQ